MQELFGIPVGTLALVLAALVVGALAVLGVFALRNRVFVRLGVRNVRRRPARSALIVTGLMLGTAIVAAALATGDTMSHTIRQSSLAALGETDEVVSVAGAEAELMSGEVEAAAVRYFPEGHYREIAAALEVQALVGDRIVVCDADEGDWLRLHLDHGFRSLMSTPALAMYQTPDHRPILDYTRLADGGDIEGAWALQRTLERERDAFERWMRDQWLAQGGGAIPIAELKAWLGLMGLPQGPVRPPLIPLGDQRLEALRADLDALDLLDSLAS